MRAIFSRKILFLTAAFLQALPAFAEAIRLAQDPALSPDGKTLAFAWRGDLWSVPIAGGAARRLTLHPGLDSAPAFSPDGKQLAFVSTRERSRQAYVVPVEGGEPRQLTWHTEGYQIEEWMPDGRGLLVSVARDLSWMRESRSARLAVLAVDERKAEQVLFDDYAEDGAVSPDGRKVLFVREGEAWWRQGYHGSRAGQIWLFDRDAQAMSQIKAEATECRWPLWRPDGKGFYYVANRSGAYNLWEHDLASGRDTQRTKFATDSVVFPAISRDGGTLVFRHLFDFYRWHPAGTAAPEKIAIERVGDVVDSAVDRLVLERATDAAFTADGLQVAFVSGGDVWVMDTVLREPRQVTQTAEEERGIVFAPDGKSLCFVSDAGGQTDVWKAVPAVATKYWWENAGFTLVRLTNDAEAESRVRFSPDGQHLAWLKVRGDIWLAEADGQNPRRLLESWNAPEFDFSPNGSWLVYSRSDEWFNGDVWVAPVDGARPPFNLSRHPDNDSDPVWSPDGRLIAWTGKRENDEVDIFYVWLRAEDEERTKRERTLTRAREKIAKAAAPIRRTASTTSTTGKPSAPKEPVKPTILPPELENIHERIHRITIPNTAENQLAWSPDSKKLAFTATIDGRRGTYSVEFPDGLKPKLIAPVAGSALRWLKQDDQIVCLLDGKPASISVKAAGGAAPSAPPAEKPSAPQDEADPEPVAAKASTGAVNTFNFKAQQSSARAGKQRAVFDQCWQTMRDRYYDERLGNRDWDAIRTKYADAAATAPDMRGVVDVVQLMLGELNGSHLGFTIAPPPVPANTWREETAHLGLRFDSTFAGPGWKVRDVLQKGPASHTASRIEPGEILLRIDGRDLSPALDPSEVLNGPLDRDILLRVLSVAGLERDVTLRPISYTTARTLLYEQWIKDNRSTVEKTSGGTLGYLHISKMDDASFQRFQEELYAAGAGRDGLIIDVRENGGGSTTDHLLTALSQPQHAITAPRGGTAGYPQDRIVYAVWTKPIAVLCNQNSFSNAEIFSHAIKTLKRGALIGVPSAGGVISTGSTNIMEVGTLRLPFRGWYSAADGQDMELNGAQPDHIIWPQPGEMGGGLDRQLQKAIEVLQTDVKAWKKRTPPTLRKASERKP